MATGQAARIQDTPVELGAGVRFRPIARADNAAVARVIRTVMLEIGADGPGFAIHDPEVNTMFEAFQGRAVYFVVEQSGIVKGGGGVAPLVGGDPSICELKKMYFMPELRHGGIGRRLTLHCLDAARALGYQQLYIETLSSLAAARSLYESLGAKPLAAPLGNTGHFSCDTRYLLDL